MAKTCLVAQHDRHTAEVERALINLNDRSIEGERHRTAPVFNLQYHPEAALGTLDGARLFERFRELVEASRPLSVGTC
jgi:carbamoyl-phosphate synthase small subunit